MPDKLNKRRGLPPQRDTAMVTTPKMELEQRSIGYPALSFRHIQPGYCVEALNEKQRSDFLLKWHKRSAFTWQELQLQKKHGLGYESLPRDKFNKALPDYLNKDSYWVFRHQGNLPFVGFKAGDTFYVIWIEANYGDVYNHNGKVKK